jgi:hypothetical protein
MQSFRVLMLAGVLGTAVAPAVLVSTSAVAVAQQPQPPTKQQLETAVRSANPTIGQLRALKRLEPNVSSMTPAQLKSALGQIFTVQQLEQIHQSLAAQGVALPH